MFVCFFTIQVNITFMESCYDFCFRLGKGKFTKYFIDLQVCPEEIIFSTHEIVFYFINKKFL